MSSNKISRILLGAFLVFACSSIAAAQGSATMPRVLQITREYTKPGKAGLAHEKTEGPFIQAMARAKWPTHYLGMTSLSGKSRALYFTSYDSFEAWEKDNLAVAKNSALTAQLDHDAVMDGELLESTDQGVFVYRESMSLRAVTDLSHMRYLELSLYQVREGHGPEWEEAVKLVKAAYDTGVPGSHWAIFEEVYGGNSGTFLVLTSRKSLAELDKGPMEGKEFEKAMGEDGMKKLTELVASCVLSSSNQLFAFNAQMSYVDESWIKAEPDFWKPKALSAPAAKPATGEKKADP